MLFSRKRNLENRERLSVVLQRTRAKVDQSEEACYAGLSPAEISMDLSIAIENLEKDERIDRETLKLHFAPTGTIQETAMDSGWTEEYLELAERFDGLVSSIR